MVVRKGIRQRKIRTLTMPTRNMTLLKQVGMSVWKKRTRRQLQNLLLKWNPLHRFSPVIIPPEVLKGGMESTISNRVMIRPADLLLCLSFNLLSVFNSLTISFTSLCIYENIFLSSVNNKYKSIYWKLNWCFSVILRMCWHWLWALSFTPVTRGIMKVVRCKAIF